MGPSQEKRIREMMFGNQAEEDYYRHCLMAMICCGDPTRDWNLVPQMEVVSEYERLCKKQPSVKKKELDYYEKKLNEFPEIKI